MSTKLAFLLSTVLLLQLAQGLHFGCVSEHHMDVNQELAALKEQQTSFEKQISGLISNIKTIEGQVNATNVTSQKVIILQNAIASEREKVFQIQNSLIPPFNLSKSACLELTNDQKIAMLDQLQVAKKSLASLRTVAARIPPNPELTLINTDINKQDILIQSIERMIYTNCNTTIVLTPTIFQTNLYATNWMLGNQTIDDIIEQYYLRSRLYTSINNCPLEAPFFDGKLCINCSGATPIFNMEAGTCSKCPYDTAINVDKHICMPVSHFTDYSKIDNYNLDGATALPPAPTGMTPCPADKPFFNGTCVSCPIPSYWSVKENKCKDCPVSLTFSPNTKNCTTPKNNSITFLEGTNWVTAPGNFTNVLTERANFVSTADPSTYSYCSKTSPFFDGVTCISCPHQFNLTDRKCTNATTGQVFNPNTHSYVTPVTGKDTNPTAPNLLSPTVPAPATSNPCDIATPYYDGISCIKCPEPFTLFDLSTKKCVQCPPMEYYDKATLQCKKRNITYISSNFTNLLATNKTNLTSYKAELLDKVNNSGDNMILKCKPEEYSNFTACFTCQPNQKFNIQTKKCETCNGTVDPNTLLCSPLKTLLTNPTAPNLLLAPGSTIDSFLKQQNSTTGPTAVCPADTPFAVKGSSCIGCTGTDGPLFNTTTQKCQHCPPNLFYNPTGHSCEPSINVTNLSALKNYVEVDNYTIANLKTAQTTLSTSRKTVICNQTIPIASPDGTQCGSCPPNTFVNLKTMQCITAQLLSNATAIQASGRVIEIGNSTIKNLIASNTQALAQTGPVPVKLCPETAPLSSAGQCIACPQGQSYDLKTSTCYTPQKVSDYATIASSKLYVESSNVTMSSLINAALANPYPMISCPPATPIWTGTACGACPPGNYVVLENMTCLAPKSVTNITALNATKNYVEGGNVTLASIQQSIASMTVPTLACPANAPLHNGTACISCTVQQYYGLQTSSCLKAIVVSNTDAITLGNTYIQKDNHTMVNLIIMAKKLPDPKKTCPAQTPLFNGVSCIACPNSLYNLETMVCINCTQGFYYNNTSHTCAKLPDYYPNLTKTKWIVGSDAGMQSLVKLVDQRVAIQGSVPCPAATPHYNSQTNNCTACPEDKYFQYDTLTCVSCPVGQTVDLNTHRCDTPSVGVYQTSLSSKNLLFEGLPLGQFQDDYNSNKTAYPNIQDCPVTTPYFDGFKCIQCPVGNPLFSLPTRLCSNCPPNSIYVEADKHCTSTSGELKQSDPNMGKMYSSIF